jgi:hypothetical protein
MPAKMSFPSRGAGLSCIISKVCVERISSPSQLRGWEKYLVRNFPDTLYSYVMGREEARFLRELNS